MVDSEDKAAQLSPDTSPNSPEKPSGDDKDMISGDKSSSPIDVEIENDEKRILVDQPVRNNEKTVENDENDSDSINENDQQLQENG